MRRNLGRRGEDKLHATPFLIALWHSELHPCLCFCDQKREIQVIQVYTHSDYLQIQITIRKMRVRN